MGQGLFFADVENNTSYEQQRNGQKEKGKYQFCLNFHNDLDDTFFPKHLEILLSLDVFLLDLQFVFYSGCVHYALFVPVQKR